MPLAQEAHEHGKSPVDLCSGRISYSGVGIYLQERLDALLGGCLEVRLLLDGYPLMANAERQTAD